ncbi:mediator complex subunit [Cladophialophora chaetospira]|uniref:Mediator of RNA polymerase II transcription subunit 5 n=1 Tax=Cladophialophora chaetospira TaxID=386627 RepID=A0AA38WVY7_9EURO|nr:mediator complex subunit [Cladophialophora chaetospira]
MTVSKWMTIARQCLLRRISVQEFGELLEAYDGAIEGSRLFAALVDCRESFCPPGDPLVSLYIDHLATTGAIDVCSALLVLTKRWNDSKGQLSQDGLVCLNHTLQDLTMIIVSPKYKLDASQARVACLITSRWLSTLVRQASREETHPTGLEYGNTVESLAFFLASLAATDAGLEALSPGIDSNKDDSSVKDLRTSMRQTFELCLPLYSIVSPQLMDRINTVLKHINLLDEDQSQGGNVSTQASEIQALQFQVSIAESQLVASKAGTTIFLGSLLFSGSTIDDGTAVNWLSSCHHNDYQAMFSDVLTSSFFLLKAQDPTRQSLCRQQCLIFIQNKLPALLSMISATSFESFSTEQAITDAWQQLSPLFADQTLLLVGAHFLHICSLVHLLRSQTVAQLVGSEDLLKGLSKGLYTKDVLVDQVNSNHARGPKLVEELIRADGSAGFISQAIILHNYCQSKETQYLKELANAIVREAQPVYDEFGAILLLILVTKSRLGLSDSELGIRKKDGFLSEYLKHENHEQSLDDLSEEKRSHLGNWINALYLAEGLSDELFSNCSPHDFYLLIPTLLRQSLAAYQQGKLTHDLLKAGLDYLLEPFLLPSLISALNWAGQVFHHDRVVIAKVLEVLTKAPGMAESRDIHHTILAICAPRLRLRLQSTEGKEENLDPVLRVLDNCQGFTLSSERDVQVQNESLGIVSTLQHGLASLITSSNSLDVEQQVRYQDIPALVDRVVEVRGADAALRALIGVLLQLSGGHQFLFALDAVTTAICMGGEGLSDALRLQYQNLGVLLKTGDTLSAEAVVRLYRQVEAYKALLTVQDMGLDTIFAQQLTNIDTADPNLDAATAVSGGGDVQAGSEQPDGIDQVLDEVAAKGYLDANDADMNFDALYGLQGNDMDLNDLDLDMF